MGRACKQVYIPPLLHSASTAVQGPQAAALWEWGPETEALAQEPGPRANTAKCSRKRLSEGAKLYRDGSLAPSWMDQGKQTREAGSS